MLQDGYEENGDSENVAGVKAENALVPVFAHIKCFISTTYGLSRPEIGSSYWFKSFYLIKKSVLVNTTTTIILCFERVIVTRLKSFRSLPLLNH